MAERAQESIAGTRTAGVTPTAFRSILALDIRTYVLGFALLEPPSRLLDWGMRRFRMKGTTLSVSVSGRVGPLLSLHRPVVLVARYRKYHSTLLNRKSTIILRSIRAETKRQGIKLRTINGRQVQQRLCPNGRLTKEQIAASLAKRFEVLSWKLPAPRKTYQSEPLAMLIFDAVAAGVAFLTQAEDQQAEG